MDQWVDIAGKFGIPVALLLLAGWFLAKKVWPFVVEQIKEAQARSKLEIERFVETIRARDVLMGEMQREHMKSLEAMTVELRGLRDEIRNGHKHQ